MTTMKKEEEEEEEEGTIKKNKMRKSVGGAFIPDVHWTFNTRGTPRMAY